MVIRWKLRLRVRATMFDVTPSVERVEASITLLSVRLGRYLALDASKVVCGSDVNHHNEMMSKPSLSHSPRADPEQL